MGAPQVEILLIASAVAAGCALVGAPIVLRRMSLMSDAISHAILLGIVLAFFAIESTASLPMLVAATATGVLTVALVEALHRTRLVKEDAAIGLVFPALFSLGVILISRYAGDVHLDIDAVLLGELAFAPFARFELAGLDLGPRALWLSGGIAALNLAFVLLFFKELKLATFDPGLAAAIGFSPAIVHYGLMTLVSVTAVGSFEAVGSVLVVALMIAPPAAAYLLTDRLSTMLAVAVALGVLSALGGYAVARALDVSIAGSMATMTGVAFALAMLGAPRRGLVSQWRRRRRQRRRFASELALVHLLHHEGTADEERECSEGHIREQMHWTAAEADRTLDHLVRRDLVVRVGGDGLRLTESGRSAARSAMEER